MKEILKFEWKKCTKKIVTGLFFIFNLCFSPSPSLHSLQFKSRLLDFTVDLKFRWGVELWAHLLLGKWLTFEVMVTSFPLHHLCRLRHPSSDVTYSSDIPNFGRILSQLYSTSEKGWHSLHQQEMQKLSRANSQERKAAKWAFDILRTPRRLIYKHSHTSRNSIRISASLDICKKKVLFFFIVGLFSISVNYVELNSSLRSVTVFKASQLPHYCFFYFF